MNKLFIFSKFREARSRLYRRRFLQPNTRWKALDEIYKMYILFHRSDLKISRNLIFTKTFAPLRSQNFRKHRPTSLRKSICVLFYFAIFHLKLAIFLSTRDEILPEFRENTRKWLKFSVLNYFTENCKILSKNSRKF